MSREVLGGLVEVQPCRGLDAERPVTHRHLVAVHREDLVLRVPLFDLDGDSRFLDLANPARQADPFEPDAIGKQLAGQLLGDRAAAGRTAPRDEIIECRADHEQRVKPAVRHELAVFR
jgi:hypothetical protein